MPPVYLKDSLCIFRYPAVLVRGEGIFLRAAVGQKPAAQKQVVGLRQDRPDVGRPGLLGRPDPGASVQGTTTRATPPRQAPPRLPEAASGARGRLAPERSLRLAR